MQPILVRRSGLALSGAARVVSRTASSSASSPSVSPSVSASSLVSQLNSMADVEDLAIRSSVAPPSPLRPIVVVKVGGEVITKEPETLTSSLAFLKSQGLQPVVVHGGGPQLNDELAKAGVQPQYIGGHRVTDEATMRVAKKVFESANAELSAALMKGGLAAQPLTGGIFKAEVHDEKLGLVGQIEKVSTAEVEKALSEGKIPVLTSLGFSEKTSKTLNINADVAARELAIALKPVRVVYISAGGGLKDEDKKDGSIVGEFSMAADFPRFMQKDFTGRQGTLLKIKEMKAIVDNLPPASSVTIASAAALASQLLPHKGPGSQIRRGVKLMHFDSLGAADEVRLKALLTACGDDSSKDCLRLLERSRDAASKTVKSIVATEDWSAAAVVTEVKTEDGTAVPVLHALALAPQAYWEGSESALWKEVIAQHPQGIAWLARDAKLPSGFNTTTMGGPLKAAFEAATKTPSSVPSLFPALSVRRSTQHATATVSLVGVCPASAVMFRGPADSPVLAKLSTGVAKALVSHVTGGAVVSFGAAATVSSSSSAGSSKPSDAEAKNSAKTKSSSPLRVGLLGARGYVGRELVRLIARHPDLQVTCASSRAFKGQDVLQALGVTDAAQAVVPGLKMSDIGPEQIRKGQAPEVDLWVLALPNGLCKEHAAAIDHHHQQQQVSGGRKAPLIVDLSADMRFESKDPAKSGGWVYGLPEIPGQRQLIKNARKIANPGCYATGAQMAILPLLQHNSKAANVNMSWNKTDKIHVFGISGYSGAGTTPSDKNDPDRLRDNILPYSLTNHIHEREVGYHAGLGLPNWENAGAADGGSRGIAFMPHVAPFFQGMTLTVTGHLTTSGGGATVKVEDIHRVYQSFFRDERLVTVLGNDASGKPDVPDTARNGTLQHGVTIGGLSYHAPTGRLALVATLDNLLKGAATQAIQNINLAMGLDEYAGIPVQEKQK